MSPVSIINWLNKNKIVLSEQQAEKLYVCRIVCLDLLSCIPWEKLVLSFDEGCRKEMEKFILTPLKQISTCYNGKLK